MKFKIVEKKNHLNVYAVFDKYENASKYLRFSLPDHIERKLLKNETLRADDFEIIATKNVSDADVLMEAKAN